MKIRSIEGMGTTVILRLRANPGRLAVEAAE
jgi:hypothetical protein